MAIKHGTGVYVGRFQVFELNLMHQKLIGSLLDTHERVMVFLGVNPAPSDLNPIDWPFRWKMFEEQYGDSIEVFEMHDLPDDRIWSQELDRKIMEEKPGQDVTLYGTKDNFVDRYSGRYTAEVLDISLEEMQSTVADVAPPANLRDFRAGIMYSTMSRFPTVYPTVDIAVFRNNMSELLLARKANETKFRLPGGFVDPTDDSYEEAALRELGEECGDLNVSDFHYIGSSRIDDWRYRDSSDCVMTHLYVCTLDDGKPEPNDDIAELRWFEVSRLSEEHFVYEHRVLWAIIQDFLTFEEENE